MAAPTTAQTMGVKHCPHKTVAPGTHTEAEGETPLYQVILWPPHSLHAIGREEGREEGQKSLTKTEAQKHKAARKAVKVVCS